MTSDPFFATFAAGLAIHLGENLLDAVGRRVRDRFAGTEKQRALTTSLQVGLENALSNFDISKVGKDHFSSLFGSFLARPNVVDEFTHLIDPRTDISLNLNLLRDEFRQAGFDETTLFYFDFETFIVEFAESFYTAAARQKELQGAIEIGLLRGSLDHLGKITTYTKRTAIAAEKTADATGRINETLEKFFQGQPVWGEISKSIESAIAKGFATSYELQEEIIS